MLLGKIVSYVRIKVLKNSTQQFTIYLTFMLNSNFPPMHYI